MANSKNNLISSMLIAYSFAVLAYAPSVHSEEQSSDSSETITVTENQVGASITLSGTVVPFRQVTLTAQIPGRVKFIAGSEGDKFDNNQILVAINDDDLLAKRRAGIADFNNANANIQNARMQYSRELYSPKSKRITGSSGMGMPSMFDQMFTQPMADVMPGNVGGEPWLDRQADLYSQGTRLSQAQGQQIRARSRIEEIDAKIRDARSVAPFPGVILRKLVEVGDTVLAGQPMLEYADTTYLQARIEVPARHVQNLSKGQMIPAKLDVGNTRFDARIAKIFPVADSERHTVTVKLDLPQGIPAGPGMYVEIMVPDKSSPESSVPVIPVSAVMWRGSLPAVYVVDGQDKTQLRMIRLGDLLGDGLVSVLSGLKAGEQIKSSPTSGQASGWASGRQN